MSDFMRGLPEDDPLVQVAERSQDAGNVTVRTLNANMGAVRVALPRRMDQVLARIQQSAQVFGDRWEYEVPFSQEGKQVAVTGPTVKCCQEVARIYGNCTVDIELAEDSPTAWTFHAVFVDIETGFRLGRPFRQRKTMKTTGFKGDHERKLDNIFLIGASKASRNVIYNALPGLVEEALEASRRSLHDRVSKNPDGARQYIREQLALLEVEPARVARQFGRPLDKMEVPHLAQLVKILQGINDGQSTAEEAFPPLPAEPVDETKPEEVRKPRETRPPRAKPADLPLEDPEPAGFGE